MTMLDPKLIESWISAGLPCEHLSVDGDGRHFQALIVSAHFAGLSRIARQQKVNALLKERFETGELHALSMKTLTPDEWKAQGA
jgi:acid stress-induced BolA-like protein IbaG/YrbA